MAETPVRLLWYAPTHEGAPRSTDWFWALGIVALSAAVLCVLFGTILLAVIIVMGALLLGILALRDPRLCEIEVSDGGIRIDAALYPYRGLVSFWIAEEEGDRLPHLIVSTRSLLNPQLTLPITQEVSLEALHTKLARNLEEVEQHESLFSRLGERLGF